MSHSLIDRSPDLKRLRDEGFEVEVKGAHLLVHSVPYVNASREVVRGTLVADLNLRTDGVGKPPDHVIHFIGDTPCTCDGKAYSAILNASNTKELAPGLQINHTFSSKPRGDGFTDYYDKFLSYIKILSAQAEAIDDSVRARTFRARPVEEPDLVFHYPDTNASRAEIGAISARVQDQKVAIIGLGGTGSYVLDFVAKTPVKEIHLFDGDDFALHNNFRAPGAASAEVLGAVPKKVAYFAGIYGNLHKRIIPNEYYVTGANVDCLTGFTFVFLCIDNGESKKVVVDRLVADDVPFVEVGIGVQAIDEKLIGNVRVTAAVPGKTGHLANRISYGDVGKNDYARNIQIAELNALNAALAVIKWKKLAGIYHDRESELTALYRIGDNKIINDDY